MQVQTAGADAVQQSLWGRGCRCRQQVQTQCSRACGGEDAGAGADSRCAPQAAELQVTRPPSPKGCTLGAPLGQLQLHGQALTLAAPPHRATVPDLQPLSHR